MPLHPLVVTLSAAEFIHRDGWNFAAERRNSIHEYDSPCPLWEAGKGMEQIEIAGVIHELPLPQYFFFTVIMPFAAPR